MKPVCMQVNGKKKRTSLFYNAELHSFVKLIKTIFFHSHVYEYPINEYIT